MDNDHCFNAAFEANEELVRLEGELAAAQARVAELESVVAWARRAYAYVGIAPGWDVKAAIDLRMSAPASVRGEL